MSQPERKLDEYGFPIPERLTPEKTKRSGVYKNGNPFQKRWVRGLFLLIIFLGLATMLLKESFPGIMADWYLQAAVNDLNRGDYESALSNADGVVTWMPDQPQGYYLRGMLHSQLRDYDQALTDLNQAVKLGQNWVPALATRAGVYQRLQRHQEAAADYTAALRLSGPSDEAMYLNNRAYSRALGNFELAEGLADAEKAVAAKRKVLKFNRENSLAQLDLAAYLDTRGLLHHLLGGEDLAMQDLDEAINATELIKRNGVTQLMDPSSGATIRLNELEQQIDESLAVMYEHRALVFEKQGNEAQAAADHATAKKLGYDPAAGVF